MSAHAGQPTDVEIGTRARTIRKRRGLSLEAASGLAGISFSYLARLERGERRFDRRGLIVDLARALGCSVIDLTGEPYAPVDKRDAAAMAAISEIEMALLDCTLDDVPDLATRPVCELAAAARRANENRVEVRFDLAGAGIGPLLTELHVVAATGSGADREMALKALVEASLVASSIAKDLGHLALAVQAAERGQDAARRLESPALTGFMGFERAVRLTLAGARRRAASELASVIDDLSGADPTGPDPQAAEACGFAHLTRAWLAGHSGEPGTAHDHLREAARIASHTGERNSLLLNFGPTNVSVWRVAIGVELQEAGKVYEQATAANIDTALLSTCRVGWLHFDLARSLAQEGGRCDVEALRHLDLADQKAPQRTRHDPVARELLAMLDQRARRRGWELNSLRRRFGIATPNG